MSLKDQKKRLGSFYTPLSLAEEIANESLNSWLNGHLHIDRENLVERVRNLKILDPACGDGAFLMVAANWLDRIEDHLNYTSMIADEHDYPRAEPAWDIDYYRVASSGI